MSKVRNYVIALVALCAGLVACTDAALQTQDDAVVRVFDNLLEVRTEFCTQPDEDVVYPVKVLFMMDQSTSFQCTDSGLVRFGAARQVVDSLLESPEAEIAFVGFSSWSRQLAFTRNRADIDAFLDPSGGLGPATDYQGSLSTAVKVLEQDMLDSGPALVARTRYSVVFLSDGVATPRCLPGCDDGNQLPDSNFGICNYDGDLNLDLGLPEDTYVDFDGLCPAYNQPEQIVAKVRDIVALRDAYDAGSVVFHSVFMFSPQEVVESVCPGAADSFGFVRDEALPIMRSMAEAGGGVFRDVDAADTDENFLEFDIRSLQTPQALVGYLATNQRSVLGADGAYLPDSDGDGLSDEDEAEIGTNIRNADSDPDAGDGYGDFLEHRLRSEGFDPLDAAIPAIPCDSSGDLDGDGLHDCEEARLKTDPREVDTDGDAIDDRSEVLAGLDPLRPDALTDSDFDGIANIDELLGGTNPRAEDAELFRTQRAKYVVNDLGRKAITPFGSNQVQDRRCYSVEASGLQLVTPQIASERGVNQILIYAHERPEGLNGARPQTFVACFNARYSGESLKEPESGLVDASSEGWEALLSRIQGEFDALRACGWFNPDNFTRGEVERALDSCMPEELILERFAYDRSEQRELLRKYIASDTAVNLPQPVSEIFVPLANFDPEEDCLTPWEVDRLLVMLQQIRTSCDACALPLDDPSFSEADALPRSPCCGPPPEEQ